MSNPRLCSSATAARNWGTVALMLGSLTMLASGVRASAPSAARWSGTRWSPRKRSGNAARMRPASEMSRVSTSTPVPLANARTMGSRAWVARAGASSIFVQMMVAVDMGLPE